VTRLACAAALLGCEPASFEPQLTSLDPDHVEVGRSVTALIHGRHFYFSARLDLDDGAPVRLGPQPLAFIGGTPLSEARLLDDSTLQVVIPSTLGEASGYEVRVDFGVGRVATLPNAFDVRSRAVFGDAGGGGSSGGGSGGSGSGGALDATPDAGGPGNADSGSTDCAGFESVFVPGSCEDGIDNDCDASVDDEDPGCRMAGPPVPLGATASSGYDAEPSFTSDLLELYFLSDRTGNFDIYVCRRSTPADAWGSPEPVDELNTLQPESTCRVSPNGLTLYFSRELTGNIEVRASRRSSRSDPWGPPELLSEINTSEEESEPSESLDGLELAISAERQGNGEILLSRRAARTEPWGPLAAVDGVNGAFVDRSPQLHDSGRLMFFKSDRPTGPGGDDLYVARRASRDEAFGAVELLSTVSSPSREESIWVSADLTYAIFGSERDGRLQLYEVTLAP
jgi:hypothetical protein